MVKKLKMTILLMILGIIITFISVQLFAFNSQRNIEIYPYLVSQKFENFEIRNYQPSLFTSVKLSTKGYKNTSSKGFFIYKSLRGKAHIAFRRRDCLSLSPDKLG